MLLNSFVIRLINLILTSNTGSRKLLAKRHGKTFKLIFPGFSVQSELDIDGYLINSQTANYDIMIKIPLDSAAFLIDQDKLAVYKKITFIGDADFGHELLDIFSRLHLDNIYTKVNSPLLLLALNKFTDLVNILTNNLKQFTSNNSNTIKEYFMYETGDIINHFEMNQFCNDVDELYARYEHLEQQIKLLQGENK